jgi:hypothetical protein
MTNSKTSKLRCWYFYAVNDRLEVAQAGAVCGCFARKTDGLTAVYVMPYYLVMRRFGAFRRLVFNDLII